MKKSREYDMDILLSTEKNYRISSIVMPFTIIQFQNMWTKINTKVKFSKYFLIMTNLKILKRKLGPLVIYINNEITIKTWVVFGKL